MSQVRRIGEASAEGHTEVLAIDGELDLATASEVRADLLRHARNAARAVVLDLRPVEFIDSSGIRVVFELATSLRDHGQKLLVVLAEGSQVYRTLQLTGVERMAPVFQTVDEAMAVAGGDPAAGEPSHS